MYMRKYITRLRNWLSYAGAGELLSRIESRRLTSRPGRLAVRGWQIIEHQLSGRISNHQPSFNFNASTGSRYGEQWRAPSTYLPTGREPATVHAN